MIKLIRRASAEARAFLETHDDDVLESAAAGKLKPPRGVNRKRSAADEVEADDEPRAHKRAAAEEKPGRKPRFAPVTFSEEGGVRYLHFGTEWVQGAMRLRHPWRLELEYAQQMMAWLLFLDAPARIAQLGLGSAALTKFCYRHFDQSHIEAVELNPAVVIAAHSMFALPHDDARLHVTECDAWDFVSDAANHAALGVMQVDLYDATARGPVLDSVAFYRACRECLTDPGMLSVNLFGDHPSFEKNLKNLRVAFEGRVIALPEVHLGNRIVLAFKGPPLGFTAEQLALRAQHIEAAYELPAGAWLVKLGEITGTADFSI